MVNLLMLLKETLLKRMNIETLVLFSQNLNKIQNGEFADALKGNAA